MAASTSTTEKTTAKKDSLVSLRKDLEATRGELATAQETIQALHTFAGQLRDTVAAIAAQAPQGTNSRPTHADVQREALEGMKAASTDPRVIHWCETGLARIADKGAFSKESNVWKVVGRRASSPAERIGRLMATVAPQQAAAPAVPALPALPNAGGDTHEEVPPPAEETPANEDEDVPFNVG